MARKTKAQLAAEAGQASAASAFFASRNLAGMEQAEQAEQADEQPRQDEWLADSAEEIKRRILVADDSPWAWPTSKADEPMSDEELAAQQAAAEAAYEAAIEAAIAAAQQASPARSAARPYIRQSSIVRPTKAVWAIADFLVGQAEKAGQPRPTRAEIIAECIRRGIASGTSATQYQAWKRFNGY